MSDADAPSIGRQSSVAPPCAVAGAVGTAAMDLLLYRRYRRGGGKDSLLAVGVRRRRRWAGTKRPPRASSAQKLERARHSAAASRPLGSHDDQRDALGHGHRLGHPVRRPGRPVVPAPACSSVLALGPVGMARRATSSSRWRGSTSRSGSTTRGPSATTSPPTSCTAARRARCSLPSPGRSHDHVQPPSPTQATNRTWSVRPSSSSAGARASGSRPPGSPGPVELR